MKMDYTLAGDYYIPNLELPQESRPMGKWGLSLIHISEPTRPY